MRFALRAEPWRCLRMTRCSPRRTYGISSPECPVRPRHSWRAISDGRVGEPFVVHARTGVGDQQRKASWCRDQWWTKSMSSRSDTRWPGGVAIVICDDVRVVDREMIAPAENAAQGPVEPEPPASPQTPAENAAAPAKNSPDAGWAQWLRVAPPRGRVASIWDDVLVVDRAPETAAENAAAPARNGPDAGWAQWLGQFGELIRRAFQPSALLFLVMLFIVAILSIIGALALGDTPLGKACVIGFVPASSIGVGIVGNHWYSKRKLDAELAKAVQKAMHTTLSLKKSVRYIDERLEFAFKALTNGSINWGILEVVSAKTASELFFANAQQSAQQLELISESEVQQARVVFGEDEDESRPRIALGESPKGAHAGGSNEENGDN